MPSFEAGDGAEDATSRSPRPASCSFFGLVWTEYARDEAQALDEPRRLEPGPGPAPVE